MDKARFVEAALCNPTNRVILDAIRSLGIRDAWLVSGCLFQTVWNVVTGRPPEHGIRDYDVFYFDDSDLSWEAEDREIRRLTSALGARVNVELRNQARTHIWYPARFGIPYSPLRSSTEAIDGFLMPAAQVGIQPVGSEYRVYAPRGLSDITEMIVRPNPTSNFQRARYVEKVTRWKQLWPELTVLPAELA